MKIREEKIDMFKSIWRINEETGRAVLRDQLSILAPRGFQNANARRADGDNSVRLVNFGGGFRGNRKRFGMHSMFRDVVGMHRPKSSGADVKRDKRVRDLGQNFRREMKAGGRRRDR